MKPDQDTEYVSSVTLMVLGEDLDPATVSTVLRLEPAQSWRRNERSVHLADGTIRFRESPHEWGGWKLFIAPEHEVSSLEEQLGFWVGMLRSRIAALRQLCLLGFECALDVLVTSSETASIVFSSQLQKEVAALGLELRFSFFAHSESEQAVPADRPKTGSG